MNKRDCMTFQFGDKNTFKRSRLLDSKGNCYGIEFSATTENKSVTIELAVFPNRKPNPTRYDATFFMTASTEEESYFVGSSFDFSIEKPMRVGIQRALPQIYAHVAKLAVDTPYYDEYADCQIALELLAGFTRYFSEC